MRLRPYIKTTNQANLTILAKLKARWSLTTLFVPKGFINLEFNIPTEIFKLGGHLWNVELTKETLQNMAECRWTEVVFLIRNWLFQWIVHLTFLMDSRCYIWLVKTINLRQIANCLVKPVCFNILIDIFASIVHQKFLASEENVFSCKSSFSCLIILEWVSIHISSLFCQCTGYVFPKISYMGRDTEKAIK